MAQFDVHRLANRRSAAAIRRRDLEPKAGLLDDCHHQIIDALDFLLTGV